jgi:putative membrane protein
MATGTGRAQTTASGRPVAGAPIATTGTPRAGTGIPNGQEPVPAAGGGRPAAVAAPTAAPVQGQAVTPAPRAVLPPGAMDDGLFAAAASAAGLGELASARLAAERGTRDDVKKFALQMLNDHTKANQELLSLAVASRMALPNTPPITCLAEQAALSGLSGEHFDRCYVKLQVAAHIEAVSLFEAEAERGLDPQLKAWAAKTLPTLKHHLHEVKAIHEQMEARAKSEHAH